MTPSELGTLSATALAAAIRAGDVTAEQAVRTALTRAEAVTAATNAVVSLDGSEALAEARAIDAARRRGAFPRGALTGVPLAHKDMFNRIGQIATWGARIRPMTPATRDATVIGRLKAAGSVTIGALHMAEFAFSITGHNEFLGDCRNPFSPDHIPGGSSSGSATAVASGVIPFSLGSDTGGSIRVPAACCGLYGLRPTWGLISRAGALPLAPSLDAIGPLARNVGDIALALSLLAGADPDDATAHAPGADYLGALTSSVKGMRVGYDRKLLERVDPDIARLMDRALAILVETGAVAVEVTLPDLRELDRYAQLVQFAEATAYHAVWMRDRPQDYSNPVRSLLEHGYAIPATDYIQALRARPLVLEDWLRGPFRHADVLFLPVMTGPVPTLAETAADRVLITAIGSLLHFNRPLAYLGLPALCLPTARDRKGMPNGFQLLGRPYAEPALLSIGQAYQNRVGVPKPVISPRP
ncbi:MAG: amidase [Telmatospirillum sp.]|nr:amidase [Telmatospirillum sp.]